MGSRRDFALSETDTDFLSRHGLVWETIRDGSGMWLILHAFPLPTGFTQQSVDVALNIEATYPDTQIDMAYFHPDVVRVDGLAIPAADATISLDGRVWKRWSRHRTAENPWRPGEDCLETHLDLVCDWLKREFERRPSPA